jgi:type I restriction-modification system DNA methylase subunit
MAKEKLTEDKAENTPAGGVLVGKRKGQTMIHNKGSLSGYLVGRTHAKGGIDAINTSTGQPLNMQGGEVIITAPAVSDNTKNEFNGKMMTNREVLSAINEKGGGVSFAKGGDIPKNIKRTGAKYKYGGKTMTDHEIYKHITKRQTASLVRNTKIANAQTRDLNNASDVLDINADGVYGADTGLYADGGDVEDWNTTFTNGFNKGQKLSEQEIETIDVYNDFVYGLLFKSGGSFDAKTEETIGLLSITNNPVNLAVILEKDPSGFNTEAIKYNQKIKRRLHNLAEKSNRKIVLNNNTSSRVNREFPYLLVSENNAKNYDLATEFYEKLETPRKESRKKLIEELEKEKQNNYENKTLEELREIHKNKYSDMPIDSPKNEDEKLLDKLIAEKFSSMNQEIRKKREDKKSFESEGSTEGKGKLYEFFTPQIVADKMLALAQHYGFKGGNVLEPATGSGRLIKNLKDTNITAFEISKDNFDILQREFPNAELYNFNFEKAFLKEPRFNTLINRKGTETWLKNAPFDLVLANPPYGKFSGLYSSYFNFKGQVEHFFILQTLYLLKKGSLGVYLIPSSFFRNGISYNDIKKQIFEIAELVDAYRLPSNIFEKTQIGTDILILRKK